MPLQVTQPELFPEIAKCADKAAKEAAAALIANAPQKATVTVPEAAAFLACSVRQVEYMIADGTLLATYANRFEQAAKRHARPVVRAARAYDPARSKYLTLEELRIRRSNVSV